MKKIGLFLVILLLVGAGAVKAQDCNIDCQLEELKKAREQSIAATKPLESELVKLKEKLKNIQAGINAAKEQQRQLEISIVKREGDFASQYVLLSERVQNYYKASRQPSSFFIMFSNNSGGNWVRDIMYQRVVADRDKQEIAQISLDLLQLEKDKKKAEADRVRLADLQVKADKEAKFFEGEISGAKAYQAKLSEQISSLLAAKFASMPVPLLAYTSLGGCSSDIGKSSGFSPRFGFFSLGVPNKTGMNQYGAKGRAEAGQSYEQILNAYYNFDLTDMGTGFNIIVNGKNEYGQTFNNESMNIEEYLKHLYEMPTSWDMKALQAQAIAARSYALARTNKGQSSIPPDQSGQVVKKEINDGRWQEAVTSTGGKVMVSGGNPISAWYSSTHGGFVLKSGEVGWNDSAWTKHAVDAGSAGSLNDLLNSAYDKASPWFYCDWGYRAEYNKTAWLKTEEVVDIVNAYMLWEKDNSLISHLSQTDKSTSETWSAEKVRQELGGSAIGSINSIEMLWDGSGISKTIRVNGKDFNAQKFKNLFNIRAPGNIQIKPTCEPDSALNCSKMYGLYNVVRE